MLLLVLLTPQLTHVVLLAKAMGTWEDSSIAEEPAHARPGSGALQGRNSPHSFCLMYTIISHGAVLTMSPDILQKQFASERIAALLEDRRVRGQDEEAHRAAYEHKIDELTQRLKKTELALQRTTKDYILGGYQASPSPQPCLSHGCNLHSAAQLCTGLRRP